MMSLGKSADERRKPSTARRVLVIKLGGLASFIQALAAAKAIREHHVGARITLLTSETFRALAEKCPYFDTVETDTAGRATVADAASPKSKDQPAIVQLIGRVRAGKYDMIYDLEHSRRTAAMFQGLRPWPPHWSGVAPGCSHPAPANDEALHPLERMAEQLRAAGIAVEGLLQPDFTWVRAALRDPPRLQPEYFGIRGDYVLLLPRGGDQGGKSRWPVEKYEQLARRISAQGVTPIVLGGSDEREIGAAIAKAERHAKNLVTRPDLFQIAGLAERAAFAVGDDVDLIHVAAAAGASCLVFKSARDDIEHEAPRGPGGVVAFTAEILAELPVDQVDRQLRNCGVYARSAATA